MAELEQAEWLRTNPQQSSATIQQLHAEVWKFRREMAAYFPTPNQADSLAFAFTEIAEAVDATLRQNPVYKRNNTKEHSVERELAQCAMMLLTAVLPAEMDGVEIMYRQPALNWDVDDIAFRVGAILGCDRTISYILHTVHAIGVIIDLPTHLRAELARMRTKHGPVQDDGPASLNAVENEHVVYVPPVEGLQLADWKEGSGL
jgi:hypothetical protein